MGLHMAHMVSPVPNLLMELNEVLDVLLVDSLGLAEGGDRSSDFQNQFADAIFILPVELFEYFSPLWGFVSLCLEMFEKVSGQVFVF